ncbi:aryl-beta-glucosidase [Sphingomonas sp. PP-CE-1A-559]|nr:aryl-beta-glucosidase [Sphingomonas sp. PP-CE-1A-559]
MIDRRQILAGSLATLTMPKAAGAGGLATSRTFPNGFLWGSATAGHQVEGNNVNADQWLLETVTPALPLSPSGDACNSFELWRTDLDLVAGLNLNCYRFSIEWSRIEPEAGLFSIAMLDHYKAIIETCRKRGIRPIVTLCHFTTPRWFAARGGWTHDGSPELFARYCDHVIRHLGAGIDHVATFNEPNNANLLQSVLPPPFFTALRATLAACAKASGSTRFTVGNTVLPEDAAAITRNMLAAHRLGKAAIKAVRANLPVGVTLAIVDDQAVGADSVRDARRETYYGAWLRVARKDDYVGVQNYERAVWDSKGRLPTPADVPTNFAGTEIYPASLANAVRYVHAQTKVPILVTEHGVATNDDRLRAELIPTALGHLKAAIDDGIPVKGYIHWSLLDNYEWGGDEKAKFGLCTVDRATFRRAPKPSANVLAGVAKRNRV